LDPLALEIAEEALRQAKEIRRAEAQATEDAPLWTELEECFKAPTQNAERIKELKRELTIRGSL
jgi:hypothetical protein